jgi:hypothetical protein
MGEWRYSSTTLDLGTEGGEWSASRQYHYTAGEGAPDIHLLEGWMGPRAGL